MRDYQILGIKVQTIAEHVAKHTLNDFLNSDSQHQVVTVNPEFIVAARRNKKFLRIIISNFSIVRMAFIFLSYTFNNSAYIQFQL